MGLPGGRRASSTRPSTSTSATAETSRRRRASERVERCAPPPHWARRGRAPAPAARRSRVRPSFSCTRMERRFAGTATASMRARPKRPKPSSHHGRSRFACDARAPIGPADPIAQRLRRPAAMAVVELDAAEQGIRRRGVRWRRPASCPPWPRPRSPRSRGWRRRRDRDGECCAVKRATSQSPARRSMAGRVASVKKRAGADRAGLDGQRRRQLR